MNKLRDKERNKKQGNRDTFKTQKYVYERG
jgi:hypothetical protein